MHFKPNKKDHNGLKGYGVITKPIPKREFMHSYSESENFPYRKIFVGQRLTIYPNLSTTPQTYGLYLNDIHVCDVGSPLQKEYVRVFPTGVVK